MKVNNLVYNVNLFRFTIKTLGSRIENFNNFLSNLLESFKLIEIMFEKRKWSFYV